MKIAANDTALSFASIAEAQPTENPIAESNVDAAQPVTLSIGQKYQGGIIFYLDGTQTNGLIAAEEDQGHYPWSFYYTFTGATSSDFGSGKQNTEAIINSEGEGQYAARICYNLELNGYDDWYLGSRNEMLILYQNRQKFGNFLKDLYWHSIGADVVYAGYQYFKTGNSGSYVKTSPAYIRAIRSF